MRSTILNYTFGGFSGFTEAFTIVVDTRNIMTGSSAANEFKFPQNIDANDPTIDFMVDWGDGQFSRIQSKAEALTPHVYATAGIYTISFYKPRYSKNNLIIAPRYENFPEERLKILEILRWGKFNNSRSCFQNCSNLKLDNVEGAPIFNGITQRNFLNNTSITKIKGLSNIIFSSTAVVTRLFQGCSSFNQDFTLNCPNTINLSFCFFACTIFNGNLIINAPKVVNVDSFFQNCPAFNKDVSNIGFDWTKITSMENFMATKTSANYNASYYDNLLIALDNAGRSNVTLGMGAIKYTSAGLAARNNLVAKGWTITDGGMI